MTKPKQLPLPSKPPTFRLPERKCIVFGRPIAPTSKYNTCSWACFQEHKATLAKIEAEDKQGEEYPF